MTAFVAALPASDPDLLASALAGYGEAHGWLAGPLAVAVTGRASERLPSRCVLDGEIDNLEQLASATGVDPSLPAEQLLTLAYDRLGEQELLALIRGGFSLLLWKENGSRALAVRDHLGERGLVWSRIGSRTVVGSEVAELLGAGAGAAEPDELSLAHWLAVMGMPEDRTMVRGIRRLLPGHALELTETGARTWPYWRPPRPTKSASGSVSMPEATAAVRAKLEQAIARRARPGTGVLLSGGIDSSSVAAFAVGAPTPVTRAYSAVFPNHTSADESSLIELTAQALGLDVVRAVVRGGSVTIGSLPYLKRWLLPSATPNLFFWLPLLERAARDGTSRLLDGQGGDELFGLSPGLFADRLRRGDVIGAARLVARVPGTRGRLSTRFVARVLYHNGLKAMLPPGPARLRQRLDPRRGAGPEWLRPPLAAAYRESSRPGDWKQPGVPRWWSQVVSAMVFGSGPTLAYDDIRRRDGLIGVSSRHPFTDVDLFELMLSLPPELSFHPDHSRPLLRAAVDGRLPDQVRLRVGKSHFDGPFHDSLAGPDFELARAMLGANALLGPYVDLEEIGRTLLAAPPPTGHRQDWALYLWRLLTAELWLRTLADRGFPDQLAERYRSPAAQVVTEPVAA